MDGELIYLVHRTMTKSGCGGENQLLLYEMF